MTEQNPPGQPTPPEEPTSGVPADGVGPTADEGAAPPPPPVTPDDTAAEGDNPPPPPPSSRTNRKPWIVGVAVVLVLALVGGAVVVALSVFGKDEHKIAVTSTAGGMERDKATETKMQQQLTAAEKQFNEGKNISYVKSAVYKQADSKKGPEGSVLFLGAKLTKEQKPSTWINDKFIKPATSNGLKIKKISAGDAGGTAACAYLDTGQKGAICAWATEDSIGEIVPVVPGYTYQQVADLMNDVRDDVETTS